MREKGKANFLGVLKSPLILQTRCLTAAKVDRHNLLFVISSSHGAHYCLDPGTPTSRGEGLIFIYQANYSQALTVAGKESVSR